MVRHSCQHVRELTHRVRQPQGQAVSMLRDPAAGGHEHRHAAHQRRAGDDALHPVVHSGRLRRALLHRIRDRRVTRCVGAANRGRHLHEDRRHRFGPDEDRLQHQGRRCAESGRDRGLHRRQRGRFRWTERGRVRDLRRHGRRPDLVHPARRHDAHAAGAAARLDLRDARDDDHRQRRVLPDQ